VPLGAACNWGNGMKRLAVVVELAFDLTAFSDSNVIDPAEAGRVGTIRLTAS
jgi:hypothetical protein